MLISEEPEKASDAGLVIAIGGGMYRIHPAANSYLEQLWRFKEGPNYQQRKAARSGSWMPIQCLPTGLIKKSTEVIRQLPLR
jgi:hypothetical protein